MKLLQYLVALACILTAPVTNADDKLASETPTDAKKLEEMAAPVYYDTAERIKAMPPCKAIVGHPGIHWSHFTTTDGVKFCIGSPGATQEVRLFLQTLKERQTYKLPDAFLAYQKAK